ncbi:MAG: hypothetical protein WCO63_12035 [Bacteroidota bacterium]
MHEIRILGILITDRIKEAGKIQKVLSNYSHIIRSRLGFHELSDDVCSRTGVIILHLVGKPDDWDEFEKDLSQIGGIEVQHMKFYN